VTAEGSEQLGLVPFAFGKFGLAGRGLVSVHLVSRRRPAPRFIPFATRSAMI
jgi:hypothetical protein